MIRVIRNEWAAAKLSTKLLIIFAGILCSAGLALVYYASSTWLADTIESDRDTVLLESSRINQESQQDDAASKSRYRMQQHQVLRQHFDAMGGARVLSSTVSLSFSGTVVFEDGTRQQVMVTKKNGTSLRISVSTRFTQTTIALSPHDSWRSVSRMNDILMVQDLPESEVENHRRYLSVVSELFLASVNGWQMQFVGLEQFNGKLAYCFDVVLNDSHTVSFFIDPESFLTAGRIDRIRHADGTVSETKRLHMDHMRAGELTIPGRVESYVDDKLIQTLIIDEARINAGVLDSIFERPSVTQ